MLQVDGDLRLNAGAGVGVDVACFDALATTGASRTRAGDTVAAAYQHAVQFYRGDVCVAPDLHAAVERERLRARYLSLLASLATYTYATRDDTACLAYAQHLLAHDPCREDAHRLVMRCHVRRGERAQALHHYGVCVDLLRAAYAATLALFEQVRRAPGSV